MKKTIYPIIILVFSFFMSFSQKEVRIGNYRFIPEQNANRLANSKSGLDASSLFENQYYVLVQLKEIPTAKERSSLKAKGVFLHDYLGANAYFATFDKGNLSEQLKGSKITSIIPVRAEWKLAPSIVENKIPAYAKTDNNLIKVIVSFYPSIKLTPLKELFVSMGIKISHVDDLFGSIHLELSESQLFEVAKLTHIKSINLAKAPLELHNNRGIAMGRINLLGSLPSTGALNLTGEGIKIGVWDSDVEPHVDFGDRLHQQEFEHPAIKTGGHGIHVSGSVAGAGIIDPLAKGMAPKADIYTYNFTNTSNRLSEQQKMHQSRKQFGISLTQNSYGVPLNQLCEEYEQMSYNAFVNDHDTDFLVNLFPTLTHVYSAGNDRGGCGGKQYGTSNGRAKNALYVGAVDELTAMSSFSSWGPMDDGRLLPTVSSLGVQVYSLAIANNYTKMDGTSMSTPIVTGTLALVTERYKQLNNGQEPLSSLMRALAANTAEDRGNKGPDYSYGYGIVNGKKAIETIENNWYKINKIASGDSPQKYTIDVPSGTSQLKVMIAWTDTVGKKIYGYRESPLINDLDLHLSKGQNTYLPWVLDVYKPKLPAKKGIDSINNMEQVSIDNPEAGTYEITINPKTIVSTKQEYALVYWFEKGDLALNYPNGKDLFYPNESIVVRWENKNEQPIDLAISYDGGNSYKTLAKNLKGKEAKITIPKDAPITKNAFIRVSDGTNVDANDVPFSIIGVPNFLRLVSNSCNLNQIGLVWQKVQGIDSFQVLKANITDATFSEIGIVRNDTVFNIKEQHIDPDKRNVFTVRAISGDIKGRRAKGVLFGGSQPIKLTDKQLPFTEHFAQYPSKHMWMKMGQVVQYIYLPNIPMYGHKPGTHFFAMMPKADYRPAPHMGLGTWNTENPFSNTDKFQAKLGICNVDLTDITPGKKILLSFRILQNYSKHPNNSLFKVLIDGEQATDMTGNKLFRAKTEREDPFKIVAFDLSSKVGKKLNVELNYVGKTTKDVLLIDEIKIFEPNDDVDMRIWNIKTTSSGTNLGKENPITVTLENKSNKTLKDIPIGYSINGNTPVYEVIEKLKPFEYTMYTFLKKADFSTEDPLGKVLTVQAMVDYPKDVNPKNNIGQIVVNNKGNVFPLEKSGKMRTIVGYYPTDPRTLKHVDGSLYFTDDGGALGYYSPHQLSSVKFLPKDANNVIQITFKEIQIRKTDLLNVYTKELEKPFSYRGVEPALSISGKLPSERTFVSEAPDGSITVIFKSEARSIDKGWIAEVKEITKENTFSIDILPIEQYVENGMVTVKVDVKNHTPIDMKNVLISYQLNNGTVVKDSIDFIGANKKVTHSFKTKANLSEIKYHTITAKVLNEDTDLSDNTKTMHVVNDRYCKIPKRLDNEGVWISEVALYGIKKEYKMGDTPIAYDLKKTFIAYKKNTPVFFIKTNENTTENHSIGIWIDWNNDGVFDSTEEYKTVLASNKTTYEIPITSIPEQAVAGTYRMRIALATTKDLNPCGQSKMAKGDRRDYTLELKDEFYPIANDLALISVEAKSGKNLTNSEEVAVLIKNNSYKELSNFKIAYKVNKNAEVEEQANIKIPAFSAKKYTFQNKADFSNLGLYKIVAYLKNNDENKENDTVKTSIVNVIPEQEGYYALNISGEDSLQESVNLGTINNANLDKEATFEIWIKSGNYDVGNIFDGKGIFVTTINRPESKLPINCIYLQIGDANNYKVYVSEGNVIKPGKWQHIAVTQTTTQDASGEKETNVKIFIDGAELELRSNGSKAIENTANSKLTVAPLFGGMIDELRIWNKARSAQEIKNNMYKHLRDQSNHLPEGLLVEFTFDEGPNNLASISDENVALIESKRVANTGNNAIWKKPNELIAQIQFEKQVEPVKKTAENNYKVILNADTDLNTVKCEFVSTWANTIIKYNNKIVDKSTVYDFSGSGNSITINAEVKNVFGKKLTQNITITAALDASSACDITEFALAKSSNTGLSKDTTITNPGQTILLTLDGVSNIKQVLPTFTLSAGAKATYKGADMISGTTSISLENPALITIIAANKRVSKVYAIEATNKQTITWNTLVKNEFDYGDAAIELAATASSGLPVSYTSSNNKAVTVADNKLIFSGVGTATITAQQLGGNYWNSATSQSQNITVQPKALTIKPKEVELTYTLPVPKASITFDGLVIPEDSSKITLPKYEVFKDGNDLWDAKSAYLPIGNTHLFKTDSTNPYVSGNYIVTAKNAVIKIVSTTTQNVTFIVKNEQKEALEANITINGMTLKTATDGKTVIALKEGTYPYTITKNGYTAEYGEVKVANKDISVKITIKQLIINLVYSTDGNGVIVGEDKQKIAKNGKGKSVLASPKIGYEFDKWSDGVTENPRQELNVKKDVSAKALFKILSHKLSYKTQYGGRIEGETEQTIEHGSNGKTVTVNAIEGFEFQKWSDGISDKSRTDTSVMKDLEFTALFTRTYELPFSENFDAQSELPRDWTNIDYTDMSLWKFNSLPIGEYGTVGSKNFAFIDFQKLNKPMGSAKVEAALISPWIGLDNISSENITIEFDYKYLALSYPYEFFTAQYRTDEQAAWISIIVQPHSIAKEQTHVKRQIAKSALGNAKKIQFRWYIINSYGMYVMLDNINISADVTKYNLIYVAKENGTINGKKEIKETKKAGELGSTITAQADSGYVFERWSDGSIQNPRTDKKATYVFASFKKQTPVLKYFDLKYQANKNGYVSGLAWQPKVKQGTNANPVKAITKTNYRFAGWTDGILEANRMDKNIQQNIDVEALFIAQNQVVLSYTIQGKGEIQGNAKQTIEKGGDGTEVKAIAAEGYRFVKWSDGNTEDTRTDKAVSADLFVKAEFELISSVQQESISSNISIYPNPFDNELIVSNIGDVAMIQLINYSGQIVWEQKSFKKKQVEINTDKLVKGVYMLILHTNDNRRVTRTIIKN